MSQVDHDVLKVLLEFARIGLTHVDLNYPEHTEGISAEQMKAALDSTNLKAYGVALRFRGDFYLNGELGNANPEVSAAALQLVPTASDTQAVWRKLHC